MKRILVITWFYPPINSSEGVVTYKLLNNSKYEYDIYTQKNSDLWSYGKEDYLEIGKNINCIYSAADNLKKWKEEAVNYFKENKDKYDIVMTRSMPPESHEIGYKIKKIKPSVKWIASFGDPIANNPYIPLRSAQYKINKNLFKYIIYSLRTNLVELKNKILENKIINNLDYIILNSNEQKEYMLRKKKNVKSIVISHSFDEKLYSKKENKTKNKKIVISYFGHLDEIRNINLFLEALFELKCEDKDLKNKVLIEFYGNLGKRDLDYIKNNKLNDLINYGNKVNYIKSLEKMCESDWLLLVDANLSSVVDKNIFFAAKLADYLGSQTPIIGITMLEGVSADILRKTNNIVLTYSKSDIKNYLRKIVSGDIESKINLKEIEKYSAKNIAKELDIFLKGVVDNELDK